VITQYASEPVQIAASTGAPSGSWYVEYLQGFVRGQSTELVNPCSSEACLATVEAPARVSLAGALTSYTRSLEVVDAGGDVLAPDADGRITIPARAPGAEPQAYRVRIRIGAIDGFGVSSLWVYDERVYLDLAYTGSAPQQTTTGCSGAKVIGGVRTCLYRGSYAYMRALDVMRLTVDPMSIEIRVAPSPAGELWRPSYAPVVFTTPALTWDGGPKSLGGL